VERLYPVAAASGLDSIINTQLRAVSVSTVQCDALVINTLGVLLIHWVYCWYTECIANTLGELPIHWAYCWYTGCTADTLGVLLIHSVYCQYTGRIADTLGVLLSNWLKLW